MNLDHLFYFATTVECGSIAEAAKHLYISPQAISRAVSLLEKELGIELLTKVGRESKPTSFGFQLFEASEEIFACVRDIKRSAAEEHNPSGTKLTGSIKIAVATFLEENGWFGPQSWDAFKLAFPNVTVETTVSSGDFAFSLVKEGLVDIAVIPGGFESTDTVRKEWLMGVPLIPIVAKTHPLATNSLTAPDDLLPYEIAEPADCHYCRKLITSTVSPNKPPLKFFEIGSWEEGRASFLEKRHGILFVADKKSERNRSPHIPGSTFLHYTKPPELAVYAISHAGSESNELVTQGLRYTAHAAKTIRKLL